MNKITLAVKGVVTALITTILFQFLLVLFFFESEFDSVFPLKVLLALIFPIVVVIATVLAKRTGKGVFIGYSLATIALIILGIYFMIDADDAGLTGYIATILPSVGLTAYVLQRLVSEKIDEKKQELEDLS